MNKYQKYRSGKKKDFQSIAALQNHLFSQLQSLKDTSGTSYSYQPSFQEFREHEPLSTYNNHLNQDVLNKAKYVTYSNKGKIERMKKEINRIQSGQGADFVTGVGLFERQVPQQQYHAPVNEGNMIRSLASSKITDLQELRRMIKKTENNLRVYSQSVYKTQTKILNAADKVGEDIDTGLAIKINRCNLGSMYPRNSKPKTPSLAAGHEKIRRRTMTASGPRRTKIQD